MWIWIIAALVLSYLPLINKKIELTHYMWLLIPIDAYGLSVAGTIIKPYMVFALILPIIFYARNKGTDKDLSASKGQMLGGLLCIMIVGVTIINGAGSASIKASVMTIVVYLCAQLYTSCNDPKSSEQLSDVFIASCFGCGVVCILAYLMMQSGFEISGILAPERAQDGLFMTTSNMSDGKYIEAYRLRGFAYDPNTMFPQFIFGITACVSRLFKKFNLYYIITLVVSVICIILSSSRMGLLCIVFAVTATMIVNISQFESIRKKIVSVISILSVSAAFLIFTITSYGQSLISSLLDTYSNRSSLTDEYGRFSIWEESLSIYWQKSPITGVGIGQMSNYTETERMTHNTWLQFLCECGIIVGGIVIIYFLTVTIYGWAKVRSKHKNEPDNTSYLSLVIGFTATIISLISVDNITNSYLWFGALLLLQLASYLKPPKILPSESLAENL